MSSTQPRLKWFMALNEDSRAFDHYAAMARVAVASALAHTRLDPHFIYDGKENALTRWLREHGVTILPHRSSLYDAIGRLEAVRRNPGKHAVGAGAFLRVDLPVLARATGITDRYVLYTDCDVLFRGEVCDELARLQPRYFAVAPQQEPADWEAMNSGVMLMNLDALAAEDAPFKAFTIEHLEEFAVTSWDQMAYRKYFGRPRHARYQWDCLAPEFNWKPYWGVSGRARIVHFHGPKPFQERMLEDGTAPKGLAGMGGAGFKAYCAVWREARDRVQAARA
jgi:hypothetical protein